MTKKTTCVKADTYVAGDRPLAGLTVTAPSAVKYNPVVLGSANVAMNEPRASNAAIRTFTPTHQHKTTIRQSDPIYGTVILHNQFTSISSAESL